ncbi:hypothetical protein PsAD5_02932 [Pseudovibrio sp. Ad5]|nr:hypothetical protein PsAD5_02932 [Pseudovibrio sp. Ad5]
MEKRLRWQWRCPSSCCWRVEENYIKVGGKWTYLYRAVDKFGNTINTDKAPTYGLAISELKTEGKCPTDIEHHQVKYLSNIIEADHGKLKQLIKPVRGFKTIRAAYAMIKGFEVMRALRKGQAGAFNFSKNVLGEARLVERAFGIGPSATLYIVILVRFRWT